MDLYNLNLVNGEKHIGYININRSIFIYLNDILRNTEKNIISLFGPIKKEMSLINSELFYDILDNSFNVDKQYIIYYSFNFCNAKYNSELNLTLLKSNMVTMVTMITDDTQKINSAYICTFIDPKFIIHIYNIYKSDGVNIHYNKLLFQLNIPLLDLNIMGPITYLNIITNINYKNLWYYLIKKTHSLNLVSKNIIKKNIITANNYLYFLKNINIDDCSIDYSIDFIIKEINTNFKHILLFY